MRLVDVDEMFVVGRDPAGTGAECGQPGRRRHRRRHAAADGVIEGRVGQPDITLAVQPDPMQLQLEVIVAVARGVEDDPRGLIDLDQGAGLERRVRGERRDQPTADVVEIEVGPAVALRFPDEPLAVLQPGDRRAVVDPPGRPLFADDHPRHAGLGVRRRELEDVLAAVGAIEQQLAAVRRPGDAVDVVADDTVLEGLPAADVDPGGLPGRHVVDEQLDDRVVDAGLWIGLGVDAALEPGLIELEIVVGHLALVEPVVGQLAAVG